MKLFFQILFMVCIMSILSCAAIKNNYNGVSYKIGQLDDSTYLNLREHLATHTNKPLGDTLIIKYNFNGETCWDMMDLRESDQIIARIQRSNERDQKEMLTRKDRSIFRFREPGTATNKVLLWDHAIKVDSFKVMKKMLFNKRSICGDSYILMPDKRYILFKRDSHFEAFHMPTEKIKEILQ